MSFGGLSGVAGSRSRRVSFSISQNEATADIILSVDSKSGFAGRTFNREDLWRILYMTKSQANGDAANFDRKDVLRVIPEIREWFENPRGPRSEQFALMAPKKFREYRLARAKEIEEEKASEERRMRKQKHKEKERRREEKRRIHKRSSLDRSPDGRNEGTSSKRKKSSRKATVLDSDDLDG